MGEKRCQRCGHTCVAGVTGKTNDLFGFRWPGGKEHVGYVLPHRLIGLREGEASNDYINFSYCLVCGQIQGKWPVGGAQKYLREFAGPKYHEVTYLNDADEMVTVYYKATLIELVHAEVAKLTPKGYTCNVLDKLDKDVEVIEL